MSIKTLIKTTATVLLLLFIGRGVTMAQHLIIWQKDGSKVSYDLDEQPKTTFTTEDLVVTTATTTISYPLSKIQRYTYEGAQLSVRDVKAQGISISHDDDRIIVKGLASGKTVSVYTIGGVQLLTKISDGAERLTLSLSSLPLGVYVIKADEITYKFTKQ